jgi:glucose/arabinose dehydrogenase
MPPRASLIRVVTLIVSVAMSTLPHLACAQQNSSPSAASRSASATIPPIDLQPAFPNLHFDRPVVLASPDDGSNLLFVVEQHQAKVWSFPNDPQTKDKQLFLELPDPIHRGNEEGLLGLTFHPKYRENGQFFVYYSANDAGKRRSVVSRFLTMKDNPRKADPKSEQRVWISADDPFENHNGGCILFGPDGFLYITLGDSGAADDPLLSGQKPQDWFGSILRIDVDHPSDGKAYGIPKDNPRLRDPERFKNWAPEVYCIGLRNVWKFSFDRENGTLWAGDVGQNLWEMVHIIENGGNYGWSIKEATHPFNTRQKADPASPITPPIVEYPHSVGQSITGGYVYRGQAMPKLVGVYLYADYQTGRIWGLRAKGRELLENTEIYTPPADRPLFITAFGEDPAGELYILTFDTKDGGGGKIYRIVPKR